MRRRTAGGDGESSQKVLFSSSISLFSRDRQMEHLNIPPERGGGGGQGRRRWALFVFSFAQASIPPPSPLLFLSPLSPPINCKFPAGKKRRGRKERWKLFFYVRGGRRSRREGSFGVFLEGNGWTYSVRRLAERKDDEAHGRSVGSSAEQNHNACQQGQGHYTKNAT